MELSLPQLRKLDEKLELLLIPWNKKLNSEDRDSIEAAGILNFTTDAEFVVWCLFSILFLK